MSHSKLAAAASSTTSSMIACAEASHLMGLSARRHLGYGQTGEHVKDIAGTEAESATDV